MNAQIREFEDNIKSSPIEILGIFDHSGTLVFEKKGNEIYIVIDDLLDTYAGCGVTHNHPEYIPGVINPPTDRDVQFVCENRFIYVRVVGVTCGQTIRYHLQRKDGLTFDKDWWTSNCSVMEEIHNRLGMEAKDMFGNDTCIDYLKWYAKESWKRVPGLEMEIEYE